MSVERFEVGKTYAHDGRPWIIQPTAVGKLAFGGRMQPVSGPGLPPGAMLRLDKWTEAAACEACGQPATMRYGRGATPARWLCMGCFKATVSADRTAAN